MPNRGPDARSFSVFRFETQRNTPDAAVALIGGPRERWLRLDAGQPRQDVLEVAVTELGEGAVHRISFFVPTRAAHEGLELSQRGVGVSADEARVVAHPLAEAAVDGSRISFRRSFPPASVSPPT